MSKLFKYSLITICLLLALLTCTKLKLILWPSYLLFVALFSCCLLNSFENFCKKGRGVFYPLLSAMLFIGFVIKYSVHTFFEYPYVEPIGGFKGSTEELILFFSVSSVGAFALLISQLISTKALDELLRKVIVRKEIAFSPERNCLRFVYIGLLGVAVVLSIINVNKNIMLFGLLPSISLPLKGNVIYFLLLTRGTLFSFFYFFPRPYELPILILGGVLCLICSLGVLSKMILVIYFSVVFFLFITKLNAMKRPYIGMVTFLVIFLSFSFLNVLATIQLRNDVYAEFAVKKEEVLLEESLTSTTTNNKKIAIDAKEVEIKLNRFCKKFLSLFVERWIGTEGVMAVSSFEDIGMKFFLDSWGEEGYKGKPIYKKIANPKHYNYIVKNSHKKKVSTSVSGPIAFFYYSGSHLVVFCGMLLFCLFLASLESFFHYFIPSSIVSYYAGTIIAFDFFQFGISPLSFFKYLAFTTTSIIIFSELFRRGITYSRFKGTLLNE